MPSSHVKLRYSTFGKHANCDWPLLQLLLAESTYLLGDLDQCLRYLSKLKDLLPAEPTLDTLITNVKKVRRDFEFEDEEHYWNPLTREGADFAQTQHYVRPKAPEFYVATQATNWNTRLHILQETWQICLKTAGEDKAMDHWYKLAAIETNILDGVFEIDDKSWSKLIRRGYEANAIEGITMDSRLQGPSDILETLKNTAQCNEHLSAACLLDNPSAYTASLVAMMHGKLMHMNEFHDEANMIDGIRYEQYYLLRRGESRRRSVMTQHVVEGEMVAIMFCHHKRVDDELEFYFTESHSLLQNSSVDPFLAVAWLQWAFLAIHPFEAGNGIISRIVSSLPLMKFGLPPVIVQAKHKQEYFEKLRIATDLDDLVPLAQYLNECADRSIEYIQTLPVADWSSSSEMDGKTLLRHQKERT